MCKCNPSIRTPYCGHGLCVWPNSKPVGVRIESVSEEMVSISKEDLENFKSTIWLARTFIPDSSLGGREIIESLERQYEVIRKILEP